MGENSESLVRNYKGLKCSKKTNLVLWVSKCGSSTLVVTMVDNKKIKLWKISKRKCLVSMKIVIQICFLIRNIGRKPL